MNKNNHHTTGNLLDFAYFKKDYGLIATDLSNQIKLKEPQQLNFIVNLKEKAMEKQCFSSMKNQKKLLVNFQKTSNKTSNIYVNIL